MKAMELRSKSVDELKGLLLQHKKESFNLRFQRAVGELENTARVRQVKRLIAKINTVLAEKNKVQE